MTLAKCECPIAAYCERHNSVMSQSSWRLCQHGKLTELILKYKPTKTEYHVARKQPVEPVGSEMTKLIAWFAKVKTVGNCDCAKLAKQMNSWGADECERRRPEIVAKIVANRHLLEEHVRQTSWIQSAVLSVTPDAVASVAAGLLLTRAIANARKTLAEKLANPPATKAATKSNRPSRRTVGGSLTPSREQMRLFTKSQSDPKPTPDPFVVEPVIHFGAHLWPIKGHWEWHVDRWNSLAEQITGKCIVGIAECGDCGTSTTAEVIARLDPRFEVFTVRNTTEGENPTFRELMKRIPTGQDDVFIYAHGKGMKPATKVSKAVKIWVNLMYETVTFNHSQIIRRLSEGYRCFGSFRVFGKYPLSPKYSWHYAGTFFAVRAKYLKEASQVVPGYGGVEAWPGNNFPANLAWVEFGDNRTMHTHYNEAVMSGKEIQENAAKWRASIANMLTDRYHRLS
jgi:hypothetical protein